VNNTMTSMRKEVKVLVSIASAFWLNIALPLIYTVKLFGTPSAGYYAGGRSRQAAQRSAACLRTHVSNRVKGWPALPRRRRSRCRPSCHTPSREMLHHH
jgi:hypothetical protein